MQLALLSTDAEIVRELDHLVLNETITVPPGEVRRPVVNEGYSVGVHSLRPELGPRGVRFISASAHIGQLRLRRSIDRLYVLEKQSEVAELEFQLRDVDAPTLAAQLAEFIRTRTPEEVLQRLVLARRSNVITICEELSLIDNEYPTDDDLIQTLLWKLGFGLDSHENVHYRFWKHHADMKNLTQTAAVSAIVDQEAVRSLAGNYFVSVEEVLGDSLAYSTWALTSDQLKGARPFTYREDVDRDEAFIRLNEAESNRDSGPEQIRFGPRNELYPLCRGYGILATVLESLQQRAEELRRSPDEVPELARYSDLRKFPFQHTVIFLDLVDEARRRIIQILKDLSAGLVGADVSDVRNEWLHYRRSTADVGRLVDCLATMERTVETLEREGLARILFRPVREDADSWGRRVHVLEDARGREIAIARPSQYSTVRMPNLRSPQFLLTSAIIAEPSEMLRFGSSVSSEYASLWDEFPKRRQARGLDVDGASGDEPSSSRGGSVGSGAA
jgi:hypothetical protein